MTDYTELKRLAEGAVHAGDHWGLRDSFERQLAKLVDPEKVLALIAENERLNSECKQLILLECYGGTAQAAINLLAERDQLKAENEALRKHAERYVWLRDKQTFIWLIQDWFPSDAEFTDVDAVIDAAMGKGERS